MSSTRTNAWSSDVALFTKLAEVLTDRVNQRLQRAPALTRVPPGPLARPGAGSERPRIRPANHPATSLARQARRVPINDGVTVLLNGVASALVDLSTLGAQVVSPTVVYPNRSVRIVLPLDEGDLLCKARIVWARVDPAGRYRRPLSGRARIHRGGQGVGSTLRDETRRGPHGPGAVHDALTSGRPSAQRRIRPESPFRNRECSACSGGGRTPAETDAENARKIGRPNRNMACVSTGSLPVS